MGRRDPGAAGTERKRRRADLQGPAGECGRAPPRCRRCWPESHICFPVFRFVGTLCLFCSPESTAAAAPAILWCPFLAPFPPPSPSVVAPPPRTCPKGKGQVPNALQTGEEDKGAVYLDRLYLTGLQALQSSSVKSPLGEVLPVPGCLTVGSSAL
uniref:Uncharacterized protein n=1 Tax=Myotis myotis TaxID=51298 RepID=A0A7J8AMT2_MYOMY|nr:hypothetical protein mMyoMyo1_008059 [Myotis myotis]